MNINSPELLLPAGGVKQLIAAVENGADAVYVGGRLFNARINADNFDNDELSRSIDYAHRRGVKVFVTMNTLVRDEEMYDAVKYACELYRMGADAIIIQDLGLGDVIHSTIPDMPLHLSTQACCCDTEAVKLAKELGYERVVLARELGIEEIRDACEHSGTEIEVFVHGALCICYSGECQLSRYYGGRSGNRGCCAQPCRLPWRRIGSGETRSYQLSPRDICLIDNIGELTDAGVCSFKIEGRMKSPEYVAEVASIYRKYIDEYMAEGHYEVSDTDRLSLMQIFNRGGFTDGYINGNPGDSLMSCNIPKNQGIRIGKLANAVKGSTLVDVSQDDGKCLSIGDGVEIYGIGEVAGGVISYCKDRGNGIVRIGDIKHSGLNKGASVFRTSSKKQLDRIRTSYEGADIDEGEGRKCHRKIGIHLRLEEIGDMLRLHASALGIQVDNTAGPFEIIDGRCASRDRYESALRKSGGTPFEINDIELPSEIHTNARVSDINALRRNTLEALEKAIASDSKRTLSGEALRRCESLREGQGGASVNSQQERPLFKPINLEAKRLSLAELCLMSDEEAAAISPGSCELFISAVSRGREDYILLENYDKCIELAKKYGVHVGNLGWLNRLRDRGIDITADYGLNCINSYTARLLLRLGAGGVTAGAELATAEAFERGVIPLIVSEHDWSDEGGEPVIIESAHDRKLIIERRDYSSQSYILRK